NAVHIGADDVQRTLQKIVVCQYFFDVICPFFTDDMVSDSFAKRRSKGDFSSFKSGIILLRSLSHPINDFEEFFFVIFVAEQFIGNLCFVKSSSQNRRKVHERYISFFWI